MSSKRLRLTPEQRSTLIVKTATIVAEEQGLYSFSIANVSRRMENTSKATIKHYFTLEQLRTTVIEGALQRGHSRLVAQAITANHPAITHLDASQKKRFLSDV